MSKHMALRGPYVEDDSKEQKLIEIGKNCTPLKTKVGCNKILKNLSLEQVSQLSNYFETTTE